MHKKFFYQIALFTVLISFTFVNVAGAHLTNSDNTSSFYDSGSNVINDNNSSDSDLENIILARSDKSKKGEKSDKSKKSDKSDKSKKSDKSDKSKKSGKSDKSLKSDKSKKSGKSDKSLKSDKSKKSGKSDKSKKRGKSKGKGKGKKRGHNK